MLKKRTLVIIGIVFLVILAILGILWKVASVNMNCSLSGGSGGLDKACVAREMHMSLLCNRISESDDRILCKATVKQSPSLCETISTQWGKDFCYQEVSWFSDSPDESSCAKIQEEMRLDSCYTNAASKKHNVSICEYIPENKEGCYLRTSALMRSVSMEAAFKICDKVESIEHRDDCYSLSATKLSDCNIIQTPRFKDVCAKVVSSQS